MQSLKTVNQFNTNQAFLNHITEENEVNFVNITNDQTYKAKVIRLTAIDYDKTVAIAITSSKNTYTCPSAGNIVVKTDLYNANINGIVAVGDGHELERYFGNLGSVTQWYSSFDVSKGDKITVNFNTGTSGVTLYFAPCYGTL